MHCVKVVKDVVLKSSRSLSHLLMSFLSITLTKTPKIKTMRLKIVLVPFWATVCKTVRPMRSDRCLSVLSVTLVYCGQTVGRIMMKLGMQVDLGHIVLHGDPVLPPQKGQSPCLLWPNGWMEDARRARRGPSSLPRERGTAAPSFRPMSIVAMVTHLSYY